MYIDGKIIIYSKRMLSVLKSIVKYFFLRKSKFFLLSENLRCDATLHLDAFNERCCMFSVIIGTKIALHRTA